MPALNDKLSECFKKIRDYTGKNETQIRQSISSHDYFSQGHSRDVLQCFIDADTILYGDPMSVMGLVNNNNLGVDAVLEFQGKAGSGSAL